MLRMGPCTLLAALLAACNSDGPVREPAELQDIVSPELQPRVLWNESAGEGGGGQRSGLRLAVEPDLILAADVSGDVFALDPRNGRRLWRAETGARVISGPAVSGDLVLLGTKDAEVIALKRADGAPAWRVTVSSEVLAPPVGEGNVIVVRGGDGKLFGLSAEDGKRLWSFDRAVPPLTLRGMSAPLVYGNTVFVGLDNGRAVALKLDSGELLWEQVVAAPSGRSELERIVDVDADLLVTSDGVYAVSFGGELAAVSLEDGRVAWRRPIKSYSGIALADKILAVTDEDGVVWALDAQSGAAAWKQEALKYRSLSPPVMLKGYIVVADREGYLHWLSPQDGHIVARVRALRAPVTTTPVARDKLLYALDTDGGVAAVEIEGAKN
ncbi:MAG: outer membrane protein assembly factor BamB [Hydrocarboniphaga effusa]|nr:outer membrane protein assembly factor BamB [Hydrocarboniphaga effusa]